MRWTIFGPVPMQVGPSSLLARVECEFFTTSTIGRPRACSHRSYSRIHTPSPKTHPNAHQKSYGPGKGESVSETTPISPPSTPRSLRLHEAERICSSSPGTAVLRLAGLYTLERGAHNYWLTSEGEGAKSVGPGDSIINLLHYDDAAGACVAALAMGSGGDGGVLGGGGRVFLVSDGNPITRRGICESALKSKLFSDSIMPVFESGVDGEKTGKVYDGSWTNEALKWKPVYPSFDEFMAGS